MNKHLTGSELQKLYEIQGRLDGIRSPVLRLQAILQYSQIVDILMLGDTDRVESKRVGDTIVELEDNVAKLEEQLGVDDESFHGVEDDPR
jgi:hypothetical protein